MYPGFMSTDLEGASGFSMFNTLSILETYHELNNKWKYLKMQVCFFFCIMIVLIRCTNVFSSVIIDLHN